MSWQPFRLKLCMTDPLPHHKSERQRSINNVWSCLLGNQGLARINELITELLTAFIAKNTTYNRKNSDSNVMNIADCKTRKKWLLAVEYLNSIICYYPTAKTRTLYKSTNGPAARSAANRPDSARLGDVHHTVPKLMFRVDWLPGPPSCEWFGSDPDLDLEWLAGSVAISRHENGPNWKQGKEKKPIDRREHLQG